MKRILFDMAKSIMLIGFVLNTQYILSQNTPTDLVPKTRKSFKNAHIGFGTETYINGDAHGTFYAANVNLTHGRSTISIGPCLQKRSQEVNGGKMSFSYLISGINELYEDESESAAVLNDIVELHALCNLQYTHQSRLSYCAAQAETIANPESTINYGEARFNTITATIGPEVDFSIKKVKIKTYAGASFFHHFKYDESMYRPRTGTALVFGLGIYIPKL